MSGKYVLFLMMNDYSMTSVQSAHSESNGLVGTSLNVCLITGTLQSLVQNKVCGNTHFYL